MHFYKGPDIETTDSFGVREFLRSTKDVKTTSVTCSMDAIPTETINGVEGQRFLQRGEWMARITSGPNEGKFGPYQEGATDGRGDTANIVGLNNTFSPWRANHRDVIISVVYEASVVQAWTSVRDADGARIPASNTVADAVASTKSTRFLFH